MFRPALSALLLAFVLAALSAPRARASPDGPPQGIEPTSLKLQTVLDANDDAVGTREHRSITHVETGRIQAYGLAGTFRDEYVSLHAAADYHTSITLGPLSWQEGQYKGQRWRQNENGITTNLHPSSSEAADVELLAADAENPKNDVTLLGEVTSPVPAYVVQVKPERAAPFWLFYDKQTSLLDRVEIGYSDERHVVTLDDYRVANGMKEAWHTHESTIGNPANDWDEWIESDRYGSPIDDSDLKIPPSNQNLIAFPSGVSAVSLQNQFIDGDAIVRVSINGRGLDMVLASGYPGILLDSQVAKELALPNYGPRPQGSDVAETALIEELAFGDIKMNHVFVDCRPFSYHQDGDVKVVGIIGFDFFASAVVDIDYEHEKVGATRADTFTPPATTFASNITLDDGFPVISAQIGQDDGRFQLDTASSVNILNPSFWQAHADLIPPGIEPGADWLYKGTHIRRPFLEISVKQAVIAGLVLGDVIALIAAPSSPPLGGPDGVIGRPFLGLFHVYFDYAHQRAYFVPSTMLNKQLQPGG